MQRECPLRILRKLMGMEGLLSPVRHQVSGIGYRVSGIGYRVPPRLRVKSRKPE